MLPMKNSADASMMSPSPISTIAAHAVTPIIMKIAEQPLLDAAVVGDGAEDRRDDRDDRDRDRGDEREPRGRLRRLEALGGVGGEEAREDRGDDGGEVDRVGPVVPAPTRAAQG